MDPRKIPDETLQQMRLKVSEAYQIPFWGSTYSEQEAAWLLIAPAKRPDGLADTSTLRRNRRKGKVPYTPTGDGSIRYWGGHLVDYLLFGEKAVLLWGGEPTQEAAE